MRNDKKEVQVTGGASVGGLLQVAFIVLKLCGIIDWSWWWVLAPTWGFVTLFTFVLILNVILTIWG